MREGQGDGMSLLNNSEMWNKSQGFISIDYPFSAKQESANKNIGNVFSFDTP
jgi:hypothetical protein